MKKRFYISVVVASLLLSGCGSSDNDGDSNVVSEDISEVVTVVENSSEITTIIEDESKVITVERGPLLDANVTDVNGVSGVELGNGEYKFEVEPTYPITAKGGYIDIDRDGVVSEGDIKNTMEFQSASGDVVTLATTMAMDPEKKALLENLYGITPQEILNETPSTSENIEAFSNIIFQYAVENNILNISDISEDQLNILVGDFQNIREEYRNDIKTAAQHEEEIIATLDIAKLNVDEAEFIQSTFIKDINIDS
ncbi:MAG: hypothetical protein U9P72_03420, partial [Campylobacterota bacterium]|nr:hypothetical protein [Campylobacterota bacterium]